MLFSMPLSHKPVMALKRHIGTISRMASGKVQLSYWAASAR
jgi:hypothetical protein